MDGAHSGQQVVRAVVMVFSASEQAIAVVIAGSDNGIVNTGRRIFGKKQDRAPTVRIEIVAFCRKNRSDRWACMLHRHEFRWIIGTKRPCITNLMAMRIDDFDRLTFRKANRFTVSGRNRVMMSVVRVRHTIAPLRGKF
jgi:hypothetical protein